MAVIAVYKNFASGGREIGRSIARELGYHYVDKDLFQKVAEGLQVSEGTLESFEQSREYRISNLFANLFSKKYIQRIVGYDKTVVEENEYQDRLQGLIRGVAKEDNAVIIGRAAHYFLREMKNCYRFGLIAPMEYRKKYAVAKLGIAPSQAERVLKRRDRSQAWFHRSVCGEDYDSPLLFHLTVNTGFISLEKAVGVMLSVMNHEMRGSI
ncbi:MAG: cytidylate kinase-like family protein [Deltaproteobacteria bacterium]|nr:cytidylate kinase-like family protein [Deltaproteobacteria bacterium]